MPGTSLPCLQNRAPPRKPLPPSQPAESACDSATQQDAAAEEQQQQQQGLAKSGAEGEPAAGLQQEEGQAQEAPAAAAAAPAATAAEAQQQPPQQQQQAVQQQEQQVQTSQEQQQPQAPEEESAKADRLWQQYLERDSSLITDLFGGQLQVGGWVGGIVGSAWMSVCLPALQAPSCQSASHAACLSSFNVPLTVHTHTSQSPLVSTLCCLQSSVTCHKCGGRFTMYEPFWDLRYRGQYSPACTACTACTAFTAAAAAASRRRTLVGLHVLTLGQYSCRLCRMLTPPPCRCAHMCASACLCSLPLAKEGKSGSFSWLGLKGTPASIQDCLAAFTADEKLEVGGRVPRCKTVACWLCRCMHSYSQQCQGSSTALPSEVHILITHPPLHACVPALQGAEAFHCERCGDRTPATKHLRVHRFPEVLVLQIKRFKYKVRYRSGTPAVQQLQQQQRWGPMVVG